jgi:hypothetical protein
MPFRNLLIVFVLLSTSAGIAQALEDLNTRSKELLAKERYEKAWPILKQAALLGHPEAQYNLGNAYETGEFIRKSLSKSIEWYTLSAEQNWPGAVYKMMLAYGNGLGVEKNKDRAFSYALQCAEDGNITCMQHLVGCYEEGWATNRDVAKMLEWSIQLGKQEDPRDFKESGFITNTRLSLAYMHRDGDMIGQDLYSSYVWFLIYNESKRDLSFFRQQHIIKEIKEVAEKLTEEEKDMAKTEAEKILGRPLTNFDQLYDAEF